MRSALMIANNTQAYWQTSSHTNNPVAVAALGVGAEQFKGYYDNADFGKKLLALLDDSKKLNEYRRIRRESTDPGSTERGYLSRHRYSKQPAGAISDRGGQQADAQHAQTAYPRPLRSKDRDHRAYAKQC